MNEAARYTPWEGRRYYICRSRMQIWTALHLISIRVRRKATRQEEKDIIAKFPESTNNCRCRDCRYKRFYDLKRGK